MKDYYGILHLQQKASIPEVKKAYRKLAHQLHPDKNTTAEAKEKFLLISEAYQILSDKRSKLKYDTLLFYGIDAEVKTQKEEQVHPRYNEDGGRKYGTAYKYKNYNTNYRKQQEEQNEKDDTTKLVEQILFIVLMVIGCIAIVFACIDLFTNEIEGFESFNGLLFGVLFTALLFFCYFFVFNKKEK